MNYYNRIFMLLEATPGFIKQARRHRAAVLGGGLHHSTDLKGAMGIANDMNVRPGDRQQWEKESGKGTYWAKGKPIGSEGLYGTYGVTKSSPHNIKPIMRVSSITGKEEPYMRGKIQVDNTPGGTKLSRRDTMFGVKPEDVSLRRQARSQGLRLVSSDAKAAAEAPGPIDTKTLMRQHRRNRKLARKSNKL